MATAATIQTRQQPTQDGAIVFDALLGERFDPACFAPDHWRTHGDAQRLGAGRGAAWRVRGEGRDWVLRHYHRGGMVAPLLGDRYLWNGAARTRGFAEFDLLAALAQRGLNVPIPVAARYRRRGVHYRADLLTRFIDGTRTLAERVRDGSADADLAARVGAGIAEFHAAGAHHADLNAHNVLVDARKVWLIDFDRGSLRAPARAWQLANLMRLRRSLLKVGAARDSESRFDREFWRPLSDAWERALGAAPEPVVGGTRG
jgi:3-deoxy-D-manno-octulosonic acid kinase